MQIAWFHAPAGIGQGESVRKGGGVGSGRISHPDPDPTFQFHDGVGPDLDAGGNGLLSRNLDAPAGRIEFQAVVHAANAIALFTSHG
jgi:hypothetical protein